MAYECVPLADSCNPAGIRLLSLKLTYPRPMHAELLTHRKHSKNSASSRAIPSLKLIAMTELDPYYPLRWGKNQSGMQAKEENLEGAELEEAKQVWDDMAAACRKGVKRLNELGLHKQWANRPLEWFSWITVVLSSTDWRNFLELRDHPAAMPEFQHVAGMIRNVLETSVPRRLAPGEWHRPFSEDFETLREHYGEDSLNLISAGRCARVSYLTQDGVRDPREDVGLSQRLTGQRPGHWSPFEHVAQAQSGRERCRNFRGFRQLRDFYDRDSIEE